MGLALFMFAFLGVFIFIALIMVMLEVISRWVLFKKCGESGWKSLIPVYTDITLVKIAGLNWWWLLIRYAGFIIIMIGYILVFTSSAYTAYSGAAYYGYESYDTGSSTVALLSWLGMLIMTFVKILQSYNLVKKFNKNGGYTVLLVFFEPIMFLILGASKDAIYYPLAPVSGNGFFGTKK